MKPKQEIKVGQVWRRKKDGRHIEITAQDTYQTYDYEAHEPVTKPHDDFYWRGWDYKAKGRAYGYYIRTNYELVDAGQQAVTTRQETQK